ncbi:MAG: hypothetical protein JRH20_07710 [Deltaproteobacteria bacterium]|nr:hypothetical protein [Deltaproteobacteria bacterium]
MIDVALRLVVALRCEAQPLIERLGLTPYDTGGRLRLYTGQVSTTRLELAISGVGKLAAATAAAYLQGLGGKHRARWLNIGVAGHGKREIGEVLMAGRVHEASSGRHFAVQLPFDSTLPMVTVRTVDRVEPHYPEADEALEMEAFGFFSAARRFANAKAVHALKIVADNSKSAPLGHDEARVKSLMEGALDTIVATIEKLTTLPDVRNES